MSKPNAYEPEPGQKYQILFRYGSQPWDHCDYAATRAEKQFLLQQYRQVGGGAYRALLLPAKYWPEKAAGN
jgi:hypothetical protein